MARRRLHTGGTPRACAGWLTLASPAPNHSHAAAVVALVAILMGGQPYSADYPIARLAPSVDVQRCENAASEVAAFGGAYVTEEASGGGRVLHLRMTEPDEASVEAALRALRGRCPAHDDVVIEDAEYSYAELSQWQRLAWTIPAVTQTGVDAPTNRLRVGVADLEADGGAVRESLTQRGVPAAAFVMIEASEVQTLPIGPDYSTPVAVAVAVVTVVVLAVVAYLWVRRRRRAATAG